MGCAKLPEAAMSALNPFLLSALGRSLTVKRRMFVSYHHDSDQVYCDYLCKTFADGYDCITDSSLERAFDSDDCDYVMRRIREKHIVGSSFTLVLCGPETRWRKYVDWEIKATLDCQHALIGVQLPTALLDSYGRCHKPDRLQDNIDSGYALWTSWGQLTTSAEAFKLHIEIALSRSVAHIRNGRPMRARNGSVFSL
jgi:hypothetical protein